jgi:protein-disulfide isomerase
VIAELFSSAFCGPRRTARTVVGQAVRLVPQARVDEVDVADETARAEAADVRSTPTILVRTDDGTEVFRAAGAPTLPQLLAAMGRAV